MENSREISNSSNIFISCPICFKNFTNDVKIITLNCGHYFCSGCLGNSNFQTFFKCSICRSINTSYDHNNANLINLFNFVCTEYQCKEKDNEAIFCIDCMCKIKFMKFHDKEFPNHKLINENQMKKKIAEGKLKINSLENQIESLNLLGMLESEVDFSNLEKNISKGLFNKFKELTEKMLKDKKMNTEQIINVRKESEIIKSKLEKFCSIQKSMKRFQNENTFNNIYKILLKFNKNKTRQNSGKFITSYIKNTKKVVVFDVDFLDINLYDISDLPFTFSKSSHSVEYDSFSDKIYISGGKQDILVNSNMSNKIWEHSIENQSCKIIQTVEYEITDHRSFVMEDFLYIIGGRKGGNEENLDIYYSKIFKVDKLTHSIENYLQLKFARSNFSISYDAMQLYLMFGVTNQGKYLNNIEIVNFYTDSIYYVELKDYNLRLKDAGTILDNQYDQIIILGGETDKKENNSKIFNFDLLDYKLNSVSEIKEIVSGTFTSYGTKFNNISAILSTITVNDEIPHVYLFSEMNKKWTCHPIDIY